MVGKSAAFADCDIQTIYCFIDITINSDLLSWQWNRLMDSPNVSIEWFQIKYIITESEHYKCVLKVKGTTSNVMVTDESGQLPRSVFSHIDVLSVMGRLQKFPTHTIVRRIYTELFGLHSYRLHTWLTKVFELSKGYGINLNEINSRNFD